MWQRWVGWSASFALLLALVGCSSIVHKPLAASSPGAHKIAIFFDGTHNDIASDTNVKRLHSLVTLQDKQNISSLYIEGVGTGSDVIGMATGFTMQARVRIAYAFILKHYRPGDEIYLFGFSRGAYAARILTSMLYHAGVVDRNGMPPAAVADAVYDAVKKFFEAGDEIKRKEEVREALAAQDLRPSAPVSVEVLGLWDTVEAMGAPSWSSRLLHKAGRRQHVVDIAGANKRYGDQLCNVKHAYQALSIDDNREWIFTPLPLDREYLFTNCQPDGEHLLGRDGKIIAGRFAEVWFAGAHSDVGGGYGDSRLSGVSLNWMIDNLKRTGLLPAGARVPEDPFGSSHDPEAGWFGAVYHAVNRDIATYVTDTARRRGEFANTLCVHESVLQRRRALPLRPFENHALKLDRVGPVSLVPEKDTPTEWRPRLQQSESEDGGGAHPLKLVVHVWPYCLGMR